VFWVCSRHRMGKENCPTHPVQERNVYAAFIRLYNKLRLYEGIILKPAFDQLEVLEMALRKENPAMLELNRDIAQATERSYKISKLRTSGLLDADAYAAQMAVNNARLAELRGKRRRLQRTDGVSETVEALRQMAAVIHQGPERLSEFDEVLFETLVEKIKVNCEGSLIFRLHGGIEITERQLEGGAP